MLIIDGESYDKTLYYARNYLKNKNIKYKILNNPNKTLAAGWNIGIINSNGEYIIRPDAHSELIENYIKIGINILDSNNDIAAVGGRLITKSKTRFGNVIKEALSLKIGVGNSFRTSQKSGYTDTVVYGIYRKQIFNKVGLFDESLIRHQDNDLHKRIKDYGGKFWQESSMKAIYYCRESLKELNNQMLNIGLNLPIVFLRNAASFRHFAPFIFYSFLIINLFLGFINKLFIYLSIFTFLIYLLILIFETIRVSLKRKDIFYMYLFIVILNMHFFYALGTYLGFFRLIKKKLL